ncbi:hypothetical protein SteCoe_38086 [Stentor coeruleus]|uniref:EGF-like domain-containing protein n=1 Tax=Stentor coeruleus TaxID=5963 RepID=A0A1R2AM74_9CILI|nr:hypothetical protein SteCoe_38086 [Stentor coeruleus]
MICLCPDMATATTSTCICPGKYYFSFNDCLNCYSECATCDQASKCLTCIAAYSTPDTSQGCKCNDGYYGTSLTTSTSCNQCYEECKTCDKNLRCLTCKSLNASPVSSQGCKCNDGYYGSILTSESSCLPCHVECETCDQESKCLTCIAHNASPSSSVGCICNDGFYGISLTEQDNCIPCHKDCKTCNQTNLCMTCKANNADPDSNAGCICKKGFYEVSGFDYLQSCLECHKDCNYCIENQCLECKDSNAQVYETGCQCKTDYFNTSESDLLKCSQCPINSTKILNTCICPDGYYMANISNAYHCSPCHESCLTCNSSSSNSCLTCLIPLIISANSCLECISSMYYEDFKCKDCIEPCLDCISDTKCTSCVNEYMIVDSNNNCVPSCEKGFQFKNEKCVEDYFSAVISVSILNKVKILFLEETENDLSSYSFILSLTPIYPFSYKYFQANSTSFYLTLEFTSDIPKNVQASIDFFENSIFSKSGKILEKYIYNIELYEYIQDINSTEVKSTTTKISTATKIITAISIGCGAISNPSSAWSLISAIQLISYIPLGSNPLTPTLITFLSSFGQFNIIPNAAYFIFTPNSSSEPYFEAKKFGYQNSVFWLNAGTTFTSFFVVFVMWPFLFMLSKIKLFEKKSVMKLLANYKYSFFVRFWILSCLEISICAIIQIRSVRFK